MLLVFLHSYWWMCSIFIKDGKILHLYENDHKPIIYKCSKQNDAKRTAVFSFYFSWVPCFLYISMDSNDMLIETSACAFQVITDYFLNNGKYGTQLSKSNGKHNKLDNFHIICRYLKHLKNLDKPTWKTCPPNITNMLSIINLSMLMITVSEEFEC